MKRFFQTALISTALVVATGHASADQFKRITTLSDYANIVVGKRIVASEGDASFVINEDGTLRGKVNGQNLRGNWKWSKGRACRAAKLGSKDLGSECQLISVSGPLLKIVSQKTKRERIYIIK